MPTRNRRGFVPQSIWYFLRQDYPRRELIVLDDGEDAVEDLVPEDARIRYVRLGPGLTVAAKRELGCDLAGGELIAHWDDDDWIAPDRLSRQVGELLATGADAVGAGEVLHYRIDAGQAWLRHASPSLLGCTLVYRREAWKRHRAAANGGDVGPLEGLPAGRVRTLEAPFYLALLHAGNVGRHAVGGMGWEPRSLEEVGLRLGYDRDFYVRLRNGRPAKRGASRSHPGTSITLAAPFMLYDGYGSMAEYLARGLTRAGATVNVVPLGVDVEGLSDEFRKLLARSCPDPSAPALYFSWPRADLDRLRDAPDLFVNTMWESSRLPADWAPRLNRARAVIVPTRFVARVFRENGVSVPIEVVPEGIDPEVYHYEERLERESLTTLVVATVIERKNTLLAIEAWKRAFADDPGARLVIKSRFGYRNYEPDDPRIQLVDDNERTRGIAHWYRAADVLLALGSEGFGLPLVEAMATGLPAIALDSEGQSDTCAAAGDLVLSVPPTSWQPVEWNGEGCGVHGVPAVDDVVARLRWIERHREEARALGREAAEWVPRQLNVWNKGEAVLDVLERTVRPKRPLRRLYVTWVPTFGGRCGVAEFTAHLAESLPELKVTAEPPDLRGTRVLRVEHEPSMFRDGRLTETIQAAHARGIPTIVNEHAVAAVAHAWERDVDLLTTTTAAGVAALRGRWPGKWIEHVPHGCPTWFPPRKERRGRVIGAFGFLERHKGFWDLLEALKRLPDTELLLFSYAKRPEEDALWEEAAAGLPVRRVREYLPEEEVARRLAAEADVLAFWYAPTAYASASGAARVGLATGVPVLTSRTALFSDLQEVTYQPDGLVEGVERLLEDTSLRKQLTEAARELCEEHSWPRVAERHRALWRTLERT